MEGSKRWKKSKSRYGIFARSTVGELKLKRKKLQDTVWGIFRFMENSKRWEGWFLWRVIEYFGWRKGTHEKL